MKRAWVALRQRWEAHQEAAALKRRAIPDALWRRTLRRFPFLAEGPGRDDARLRRMTSLFLDRKEFSGAHGLTVTDDMAVRPSPPGLPAVLHLGLGACAHGGFWHRRASGCTRVYRDAVGEDGVVHAGDEELAGEAQHGGPVMLSWRDVAPQALAPRGYNVVIHRFCPRAGHGQRRGRWPSAATTRHQQRRVAAGQFWMSISASATGWTPKRTPC